MPMIHSMYPLVFIMFICMSVQYCLCGSGIRLKSLIQKLDSISDASMVSNNNIHIAMFEDTRNDSEQLRICIQCFLKIEKNNVLLGILQRNPDGELLLRGSKLCDTVVNHTHISVAPGIEKVSIRCQIRVANKMLKIHALENTVAKFKNHTLAVTYLKSCYFLYHANALDTLEQVFSKVSSVDTQINMIRYYMDSNNNTGGLRQWLKTGSAPAQQMASITSNGLFANPTDLWSTTPSIGINPLFADSFATKLYSEAPFGSIDFDSQETVTIPGSQAIGDVPGDHNGNYKMPNAQARSPAPTNMASLLVGSSTPFPLIKQPGVLNINSDPNNAIPATAANNTQVSVAVGNSGLEAPVPAKRSFAVANGRPDENLLQHLATDVSMLSTPWGQIVSADLTSQIGFVDPSMLPAQADSQFNSLSTTNSPVKSRDTGMANMASNTVVTDANANSPADETVEIDTSLNSNSSGGSTGGTNNSSNSNGSGTGNSGSATGNNGPGTNSSGSGTGSSGSGSSTSSSGSGSGTSSSGSSDTEVEAVQETSDSSNTDNDKENHTKWGIALAVGIGIVIITLTIGIIYHISGNYKRAAKNVTKGTGLGNTVTNASYDTISSCK